MGRTRERDRVRQPGEPYTRAQRVLVDEVRWLLWVSWGTATMTDVMRFLGKSDEAVSNGLDRAARGDLRERLRRNEAHRAGRKCGDDACRPCFTYRGTAEDPRGPAGPGRGRRRGRGGGGGMTRRLSAELPRAAGLALVAAAVAGAASSPVAAVVCCSRCGAPVRSLTTDDVARLALTDEPGPDPVTAVHSCLWCGPAGVARQHPPQGPVPVCVLGEWRADGVFWGPTW